VRISDFSRYALCSSAAAAFLAGCGGSQPPIGAPGAMPQSIDRIQPASSYHVLYRFGRLFEGRYPGH
jgi:hypothetical protein